MSHSPVIILIIASYVIKGERFVVKTLLNKIEDLRQKMHVTALEKGITHPDVLMVTQRLDEVINKFYKFDVI